MASIQQLNPVINNLYQSLYNRGKIGFSEPGLADARLGFYGNNVATVFDFFEALYKKTVSIVPENQREAYSSTVDGPRVGYDHSQYTPDRNTYGLLINAFSIAKVRDWDEFQYMIDKAYYVLLPITLMQELSVPDQTILLDRAGVVPFSATITATDGSIIAAGLTAGIAFINAWNNLLVPYQASINTPVYYITGIAGPAPANLYYRKTGQIKAKVYATFPV